MIANAADTPAPRPAAWELAPPAAGTACEGPRIAVDYVLLRATGVVLSVLVLGHFIVTHFVTDVAHDSSAFVARQLSSAIWVAWDSAMLAAALAHGALGVRVAVADYASGRRRRLLQRGVLSATAALFVIGAFAIGRAVYG